MKAPEQVNRGNRKWSEPDQEWIEYQVLVLGKTAKQLASEFGCSNWVTQQWVIKAGLRKPYPVSDDPLAPKKVGRGYGSRFVGVTYEWVYQQYVEKGRSSYDIAIELETSAYAVCKWLKDFSIPIRSKKERSDRHSERMSGKGNPAWNGGTAQGYQKRFLSQSERVECCEWCGTTDRLELHHRNHDRLDSSLENLAWLCRQCNQLEARLNDSQQLGHLTWAINEREHKIEIQFYGGKR